MTANSVIKYDVETQHGYQLVIWRNEDDNVVLEIFEQDGVIHIDKNEIDDFIGLLEKVKA
jgi:hypothetical protein